jgi:predicted phosphodiesterase
MVRESAFVAAECPSRRAFLAGSAAALAGIVLRPAALRGAGRERKPIEFCVVSDTHLGYKDQTAAAERWKRTAAELARAPGDFVLHLGDVVDGGRAEQYPIYLETRKTIGKPVHEVPGNHDSADLFEQHIRRPIDVAVDHEWLRLLLLNDAHRDSHDGFLTAEQLAWIDRQCVAAAETDRLVAICLHVPVHANKHPDRGWHVKPDHGQTAFYEILAKHRGRIVATFHGHFHNGIRGWDDHAPVHEICFPSALYNQDRMLAAGGAPGYNLAEFRPGFTEVALRGETLTLRYRPVGFEPSVRRELPLPARPEP